MARLPIVIDYRQMVGVVVRVALSLDDFDSLNFAFIE
jgi:hypothetical protein